MNSSKQNLRTATVSFVLTTAFLSAVVGARAQPTEEAAPEPGASRFLQLSLWAPRVQLFPPGDSVGGLSLGVYGRSDNVTGLSLMLASEVDGHLKGASIGFVNSTKRDLRGLQLVPFGYSRAGENSYGVSSSFVAEVAGDAAGWHNGLVNRVGGEMAGLQGGLIYNGVGGTVRGVQLGLINTAWTTRGVQLGIVNFTQEMQGLQVGLWNEIESKRVLRIFPLVNWKF